MNINENTVSGKIILCIATLIIMLSLYLKGRDINVWIYLALFGLIMGFVGAYYYSNSIKINPFIKDKKEIKSFKDVIKIYSGLALLSGLIYSLLSKYSLKMMLFTIIFFEIGLITFFYVYHFHYKRNGDKK